MLQVVCSSDTLVKSPLQWAAVLRIKYFVSFFLCIFGIAKERHIKDESIEVHFLGYHCRKTSAKALATDELGNVLKTRVLCKKLLEKFNIIVYPVIVSLDNTSIVALTLAKATHVNAGPLNTLFSKQFCHVCDTRCVYTISVNKEHKGLGLLERLTVLDRTHVADV